MNYGQKWLENRDKISFVENDKIQLFNGCLFCYGNSVCLDAFTEIATHCGNYNKQYDDFEERKK